MFSNLWSDYKSFYSKPFSSDMDVTGWFLFIGLMIVLLFAWGIILGEFARLVRSIEE
jgi:uncharacterized membrane protein